MPRPTKLTKGRVALILREVAAHGVEAEAARKAGISGSAIATWKYLGRKDLAAGIESRYTRFLTLIEKAIAEFEASLVTTIREASAETWTAAAWLLERKFPDRYGRRERIDIRNVDERIEEELARIGIVEARREIAIEASPRREETSDARDD